MSRVIIPTYEEVLMAQTGLTPETLMERQGFDMLSRFRIRERVYDELGKLYQEAKPVDEQFPALLNQEPAYPLIAAVPQPGMSGAIGETELRWPKKLR